MTPVSVRRIGEILIAEGALTEAAVNRALRYQRVSGERIKLGTILLNWDLLAEERLLRGLARFHRVAAAPWSLLSAAPIEVTRLIPAAMAIRLGALPYAATPSALHVAFLEPSNLAAVDEVAAVTNKRVIPAVALEIRLLQAHQKFYGRHVPLEYRSIVQKLERRTTKTKLPDWQKNVDFRVPNLAQAERTAGPPIPPPPPGIRTPSMDPGRTPIERGLTPQRGVPDALPPIEIPEMPQLTPLPAADRFSDTNPLPAPVRPEAAREALSDTHPVGQAPVSRKPAPGGPPLDDTLPRRMGAPRGTAAHLRPRDHVADMWRPAADEVSSTDAMVSGMWTPSAAEIEPSIGQTRSRDEIGQVALEAFLAKLPRVVLLGCGKSAVTGWQGRGKGVTPEFVSSLRIALAQDTVFASIQASGVPHFGPLEQDQWPPELAEALGERAPDCAVFPIRILDGIAAFLYADRLGEPMDYEDFAVIARACAATANALARFLLRRHPTAPLLSS